MCLTLLAQLDCLPPFFSLSFVLTVLSLGRCPACSLAWWNPLSFQGLLILTHLTNPDLAPLVCTAIALHWQFFYYTHYIRPNFHYSNLWPCLLHGWVSYQPIYSLQYLIIFKEWLFNKHLLDLKQLRLLVKVRIIHPTTSKSSSLIGYIPRLNEIMHIKGY